MRHTLVETVQTHIPPHFQDAQHSLANHRKNCVSLLKVHKQCAQVTEQTERGTRLIGEKLFNETIFSCLNRALALKKGVKSADRICKFVATYAAYAQEQFNAGVDDDSDTTATRFIAILLKHLLKGFRAKDKNVRLRCCGCVALLINSIDSIDDDLYETLVSLLMERLTDRESGVRVQAIVALARLQSDEEGTDQQTLRLLLHRLRHDASAEVRRAALFNITPTTATLPYLLERLQDVDTTNRRCVYLGSLKMLVDAQPLLARDDGASVRASLGLGEVSLSEVIRVGLHERDASVQKAARKLVAYWLEAMGGDILTLLEHLHVSRTENGEPVVLALLEESQEVRTTVQALLEDHMSYWAAMTPAKALLARCFVLYSTTHHMERALESCIPVVTALVFRIQAEYEALSQSLEQQAMEEAEEDDGDGLPMVQDDLALSRVFTVNEMLTLAMYCDYGDEMGRRKMYMLVREMLGNAWLPSKLVPRCLDVLLRLSSGQRDFLQLVVELVQSLEADIDEDMAPMANEGEDGVAIADTSTTRQALSWHQRVVDDASPAQAAHMAELEARRLLIVRSMLERLSCSLQGDATLEGLIQELIVPTVQSKDAMLREQGLVCLGLCSLLDPKTALVTFPLLLSQIQRAQGTIRVRCVECLFDLTVMHGIDMLCAQSAEVAAQNEFNGDEEQGLQYARQQMIGFLLSLLEHDDPQVQATASEGISKLLLTGVLFDDDVLKSLVLTYMSPDTADNQALRQCLSYFLPLFCSSDVRHQHMIQRVFVDVLDVLSSVYEDPDAQLHMVTPTQIVLQLLDWTNPERLLLSQPDDMIHIDMAIDALRHGLTSTRRDERKAIVAMLSKLTWPTTIDTSRATQLALLADALQLRAYDATTRNAIARFISALQKHAPSERDEATAEDLRAWIATLPPPPPSLVTQTHARAPAHASASHRRSVSVASTAMSERDSDMEEDAVTPMEYVDEDDEDELAL